MQSPLFLSTPSEIVFHKKKKKKKKKNTTVKHPDEKRLTQFMYFPWPPLEAGMSISTLYFLYTVCHRRNGPNFGRVFLVLNYTDITQNTYIQS